MKSFVRKALTPEKSWGGSWSRVEDSLCQTVKYFFVLFLFPTREEKPLVVSRLVDIRQRVQKSSGFIK